MPVSLPAPKKQSQRSFLQIREKGRLARQVLHSIVVEGVIAVALVPSVLSFKRYFAEKEGNRMKRSWSEQFLFPLSFTQPALTKQSCCREGPGPALLIQLPTGFTGDTTGKMFS